MAPYTYVELALSTAPGDRIHFGSLEFTDINGLAPVDGLIPDQALCFGDLDCVANHLGLLWLSEENVASLHIKMATGRKNPRTHGHPTRWARIRV